MILASQHILNIKALIIKCQPNDLPSKKTQRWWPSEKRKITSSNSRWMEYVNNKDTPHHFWTSEIISHLYENDIMLSSRTNTISGFLSFDPNIYYLVDSDTQPRLCRAIPLTVPIKWNKKNLDLCSYASKQYVKG